MLSFISLEVKLHLRVENLNIIKIDDVKLCTLVVITFNLLLVD
jgi:hypothetical protein